MKQIKTRLKYKRLISVLLCVVSALVWYGNEKYVRYTYMYVGVGASWWATLYLWTGLFALVAMGILTLAGTAGKNRKLFLIPVWLCAVCMVALCEVAFGAESAFAVYMGLNGYHGLFVAFQIIPWVVLALYALDILKKRHIKPAGIVCVLISIASLLFGRRVESLILVLSAAAIVCALESVTGEPID
ncbi:MAG: hypothetical protein LBN99_00585 [Oscillospiraceae bacterium]|jgi:hypothetical protein|nr:hypothetical protein [Oscillospiraceae bacterium]